jgi:predicted transcriptional regulator
MVHTTVKVTDEVKKKLMRIAGELKAERGEDV